MSTADPAPRPHDGTPRTRGTRRAQAAAGPRTIREVARLTGLTSRTLRHYGDVGLLPPAGVGHGGVRLYGDAELLRLQQVLVLRGLGVPLQEIRDVVDGADDALTALRRLSRRLEEERRRLDRRRASLDRTITALEEGGPLVAEEMFDGFDHTQHQEEVQERWGSDAWAAGDTWWRGMSDAERSAWRARSEELGRDWATAAAEGVSPGSDRAQDLARRHVAWLAGIPGTPGHGSPAPDREYVLGLADMYVEDDRFARAYGGTQGATLVRDALRHLLGGPA